MKRIIAVSMLVVMLLSFTSCGLFNKTYEADGFSIELSATFIDGGDIAQKLLESTGSSYDGRYAAYTSLIEGITVVAATETLGEYDSFYGYVADMADSMGGDSSAMFEINGNPAFEFYQDIEIYEMKGIVVCYNMGNDEVWLVTAFCKPDKFEEKREKLLTYLESVEVE